MAHTHEHSRPEGARGKNRQALAVVLALTASFTVIEVVGGLRTSI